MTESEFRAIFKDMILLFTDFGLQGPYVGQMKTVLAAIEPNMPVIDLMHDAPVFDSKAAAYLLASLVAEMPQGAVVLAVVDPGVGSQRRALAVEADGRWYVGPDNGLFELVMRRSRRFQAYEIAWCPAKLSASFHGRDLFAPVAARLSRGDRPDMLPLAQEEVRRPEWPDDWAVAIYLDRFGNVMTGLRASQMPAGACILAGGRLLKTRRTFFEAEPGEAFWYSNSCGLVEIAVNQGDASEILSLVLGSPVQVIPCVESAKTGRIP
ncbi:conserved hypothetical protein [Rhodospirillaceae bacterium LM-1]|nr:conserved hypothetical protein [Rhodospirillaceae bacterium LM-1]